jgi:hypothetical protein
MIHFQHYFLITNPARKNEYYSKTPAPFNSTARRNDEFSGKQRP